MRTSFNLWRIAAAVVLCGLAVARLLVPKEIFAAMDGTFFGVLGGALILALVPVERMSLLKAGSVEVALQQVEVRGAIDGLNLDRIRDAELRSRLSLQEQELRSV